METKSIDRIYQELRSRICLGQYRSGDILYETALGREFDVSRTPIRQVLQRLAMERLAVVRTGVGTLVLEPDRDSALRAVRVKAHMLSLVIDMNMLVHSTAFPADLAVARSHRAKLGKAPTPEALFRMLHTVQDITNGLIVDDLVSMADDMLFYRTAPRLIRRSVSAPQALFAILDRQLAAAGQGESADHLPFLHAIKDSADDLAALIAE